MKRPAFQFYPADWRKDMALQSCSVAARGLWIDCMCIAHECEPYGHLMVNGRPMTPEQIGRHTGLTAKECAALLAELDAAGVSSRTSEGVIFSRRMVRDEDLRERRAAGGLGGAEHGYKGAKDGIKGGRPTVQKGGYETPLTVESEPPPSSSSSSSPSGSSLPLVEKKARKRADPPPESVTPDLLIAAGIDEPTAAEFIAHKARAKAPLTARAWADHLREAEKAGWTPQQAAEKVMAKSWKGFEAKYVASEPAPMNGSGANAKTFRERDEENALHRTWQMTGGLMGRRKKGDQHGEIIDAPAALAIGMDRSPF